MSIFQNKKVLVVGGTGLIGRPLVSLLDELGAQLTVVSLDKPTDLPEKIHFVKANILDISNAKWICEGKDYVFNLFGVKGSAKAARERPASYFVPTILGSINMMEAARLAGVKKYLYTSSIGVYSPARIFMEADVWKTFPSDNDRFAGWAKRMGELQAEAYKKEYGWDQIAIVRPANVYGPYDRFDLDTGMVISSLIKRAVDGENPMTIWGDGSELRDFIHAKDVAEGMILAMEKATNCIPINLGSGRAITIRSLVETVQKYSPKPFEIVFDPSQAKGDSARVMDISRAKFIGFKPKISLDQGIKETMEWYFKNKDTQQYNVFKEKKFI